MGRPVSWQQFINDMLWKYFNKFCTAYLNNILIYSTNLKEHKDYVKLVLAKLHEFGIQTNVNKCEFYMTKTKYLRLIISTKGIKINPAKIKAIRQWDTPTCMQEVCSFVEFCNFYRQFIKSFSKIAGLLNALIRNDVQFTWTLECKKEFQ